MLEHNYIGTEHILLGLLHEGEGVAAQALEKLGVPLDDARARVEKIIGRGQSPPVSHIPFTPRAKRVLELSLRESQNLGHNYIGTEHILLGLVREGEGVAAKVLQIMGVELNGVRQAVVGLLSGYKDEPMAEATITGPEPEMGPLCPQCRRPLTETAAYRSIEVPAAEGEGERTTFKLVFCRSCGTSLGNLA